MRVRASGYGSFETLNETKETHMGDGTTDDLKGRVKEAGGDLTGDKELKNEGKVDQASGKAKDAVGGAADKLKGVVGKKD